MKKSTSSGSSDPAGEDVVRCTMAKRTMKLTVEDVRRIVREEASRMMDEVGYEDDLDEDDDLDEVTPPGGEKVVRALKKEKGVQNPYAVAWSMRKKGMRFKK